MRPPEFPLSSPDLKSPAQLERVFSVSLGEACSLEELHLAFSECNESIDRLVTPKTANVPWLSKLKLRFRLRLFFVIRQSQLAQQLIPE